MKLTFTDAMALYGGMSEDDQLAVNAYAGAFFWGAQPTIGMAGRLIRECFILAVAHVLRKEVPEDRWR